MSSRWILGMAVSGLGAVLMAGGCDSSSSNSDGESDPPPGSDATVAINVDGAFSGTRSNTNGVVNISFSFNQSGDVLTGSCADGQLGNGILSGTIDGDDLEFTTVMASSSIILEWDGQATTNGSAIAGTWSMTSGGTGSGQWSVMR